MLKHILPVHILLVYYVSVKKQCIIVVGDGVRECMEPELTEVIFMAINDQTQWFKNILILLLQLSENIGGRTVNCAEKLVAFRRHSTSSFSTGNSEGGFTQSVLVMMRYVR